MQNPTSDHIDLPFYVIKEGDISKLLGPQTTFKAWPQAESQFDGMSFLTSDKMPTERYHFAFITPTAENMVGLDPKSTQLFNIPWELTEEETVGPKRYLIFTGWGDPFSGGQRQFEGHEIGIESLIIYDIIKKLMRKDPQIFSRKVIGNVIGLESFSL
ncbi:hypothetical protein [uncultured Mucilaginibacter sp.]|uniref:hypothetical protein n=1 Tax=uncultured Mucilaginibacter sp. TaxID=797541 RepID=UPI0025E30262|nr:hypothetical protein [uncultured Mucilaginibacter sp.]